MATKGKFVTSDPCLSGLNLFLARTMETSPGALRAPLSARTAELPPIPRR